MGEVVSLSPSGKGRGNGSVPRSVYSSTFSGKGKGEAISALFLSGNGRGRGYLGRGGGVISLASFGKVPLSVSPLFSRSGEVGGDLPFILSGAGKGTSPSLCLSYPFSFCEGKGE